MLWGAERDTINLSYIYRNLQLLYADCACRQAGCLRVLCKRPGGDGEIEE